MINTRKKSRITAAFFVASLAAGIALYPQVRPAREIEMPAANSFRILLGVGDENSARWDGSLSVSPGKVADLHGWRFRAGDSIEPGSRWKLGTGSAAGKKGKKKKKQGAVFEGGVVVTIASTDPNEAVDVRTAQGAFSFHAGDIPYGKPKEFLSGRVSVDRVPATWQLTHSAEEQDYPAVAQAGSEVYVSYVEFLHGNRDMESKRSLSQAPKDFAFLARPAGGDQVMLMRFNKSSRKWSPPMAVSAAKQDVMRTAVAVDGGGRAWVFWSANKGNNFDIYGRSLAGGKWSPEVRITTDSGTDINPVAATDAKGRVWVAWQGYRNRNLEILAAAQNGDGFSKESVISFSPASDWDPAIATAPNGEVAVSWDTYDKGDYDVYFRRLRYEGGVKMEKPAPVAASTNFEARSSVAYDAQNRLWVAYETSDTKWGKDFGAYETTGVALYQDHNLRVKCFQGSNAYTAGDLEQALPSPESGAAAWNRGAVQPRRRGKQAQAARVVMPDPSLAKDPGNASPAPPPMPLNSFPRLASDPSGFVYLSFRTPVDGKSAMGSIWIQDLVYFDGAEWRGPLTIPNTDGLLDGRAAVTALGPGEILVVATGDHRMSISRRGAARGQAVDTGVEGDTEDDAGVNTDLFAADFRVDEALSAGRLTPAPAEVVAAPGPGAQAERDQIARMRKYRARAGGDSLRVMRGEFHRHTEMSGDGGRDGPIIDAYRYLIDAASMDWAGCCDHDNGGGREYSWWIAQKLTDAYKLGDTYVPVFAYERSVKYPEGHRNAVFAQRGIRPLPRLPISAETATSPAPDTQMLYRYLKQFNGIVASHTSATGMGTDWRDNDPKVEPVVEIYQGDRQNYEAPGAPRSNSLNGGRVVRPLGFVSQALQKGYRLGFQASSDHISTHMSYCNLWVTEPTREGLLEAFRKRRIYGATDNILADVRCGSHFMGEEFTQAGPVEISVKLWGTDKFAKVHIIRDGEAVYSISPNTAVVDFTWKDAAPRMGQTSYYYVRGEQADGEMVWVSPMWIKK